MTPTSERHLLKVSSVIAFNLEILAHFYAKRDHDIGGIRVPFERTEYLTVKIGVIS